MSSLLGGFFSLTFDWVEMVESEEVLAHDESLLPLLVDLSCGQWLQKKGDDDGVEQEVVLPGWEDSRSGNIGEVALLDVEHVECSEE